MAHVARETQAYLNCVQMVGVSMAAEVKILMERKAETEKTLGVLGKHKALEVVTQQAIGMISSEIKILSDKLAGHES